jgi:hypothetical protein
MDEFVQSQLILAVSGTYPFFILFYAQVEIGYATKLEIMDKCVNYSCLQEAYCILFLSWPSLCFSLFYILKLGVNDSYACTQSGWKVYCKNF